MINPYLLDNKIILAIGQMMMNGFIFTEKFILFSIKCGYSIIHDEKTLKIILKMNLDEVFKYACIHHVIDVIKFCLENKYLPKTEHLYCVLLGKELSSRISTEMTKKTIKEILILFMNYGFQLSQYIYELLVIHDISLNEFSLQMISSEAKRKIDNETISIKSTAKLLTIDISDKKYYKTKNTSTYQKIEKSKYKCDKCHLCASSHLSTLLLYLETTGEKLNDECMHNSVSNSNLNVFEYIHDTYKYIPSIFTILMIFDYSKRYTFLCRFYPHLLQDCSGSFVSAAIDKEKKPKKIKKNKLDSDVI
jgi:hypothetical protein